MKKAYIWGVLLFGILLFAQIVSAEVTVDLVSPEDYSSFDTDNVILTFTAESNETINYCGVASDIEGDYIFNEIESIINNTEYSFNVTNINDSVYNYTTNWYSWSVFCVDNSSIGFSGTRHFSVDAVDETKALLTADTPEPSEVIRNTNDIIFAAEVEDDWGLDSCWLKTDRYGSLEKEINSTIHFSGAKSGLYYYTINDMPDGHYTWNVYCNDTSNNIGSFAENQVFELDFVNDAPSFAQSSWSRWVVVQNTLNNKFNASATDYNENSLTYSVDNTKSGKLIINPSTGIITFSPTEIEVFSVLVRVCDNGIPSICINRTLDIESRAVANSISVANPTISSKRNITEASTTFRITNTGDETLSNFEITTNSLTTYNVKFSGIPASLAPGSYKDVTVYADIDLKAKGGVYSIGTLTVKSDKADATATLYLDIENKLSFSEISLTGGSLSSDYKNIHDSTGKTISSIKPGDNITLSVNVENLFSDSSDEIYDIELSIVMDDMLGDGEDFEFESFFDLRGGKKSGVLRFNFVVPYDVQDGDRLKISISAEGKDKNRAVHSVSWDGIFDVRREARLIKVDSITASKTQLKTCEALTTQLTIKVANLGEREEKDVVVKVWNSVLGIDSKYYYEEMDAYSDSSDMQTINHRLDFPKDIKPGVYTIQVDTFYRTNQPGRSIGTINIEVVECEDTTTTETPATDTTSKTTADSAKTALEMLGTSSGTSGSFVTSSLTQESGVSSVLRSDNSLKTALIAVNVIVGIAVISILIKTLFFRPKSAFGFF